jgi:dethiobiotin synthetase
LSGASERRASAFLVTGTDTGIGKTLVGCALAAALSATERVAVLKPAETGCREERGELVPDDAVRLREAAGSEAPLDLVCPFRYAEPLAPALAASRAGRPISIERIRECFERLKATADWVLVESAGGLLVPLVDRYSFAELAADLSLTLVVVVGSRLGALNQALLTFECAKRRGLAIAGYVMNQLSCERDLAQQLNASALAQLTDVPSLGEVPFLTEGERADRRRLAAIGAVIADRLR